MRAIGNAIYVVCRDCGKIVRWNKPLVGALHFCTTEEERRLHRKAIALQVKIAERELASLKN